jgi:primosomal protein N'
MYYRVIPFSRSFDTFGLIYRVPDFLLSQIQAGMIVKIPLKGEIDLALTMEEVSGVHQDLELSDIKIIEALVSENIFLPKLQRNMIDYISEHYITPIHHALGLFFPKNLLEKIEKNTFFKIKVKQYTYQKSDISLSKIQQEIFEVLCTSSQKKHLIYWVTWSGKTQIYMKIIEKNLCEGKQTLLLIPEIILTSQIGERVQEVFWEDIILLHSWVSQAKKTQFWCDIAAWSAKIIVGTRSSLFYPYPNLATIIIDEEHDTSYISDSAPRYHTREVAQKLCELWDIEIILWSWTPKVETFYRALQWEFQLHQLLEKYTTPPIPKSFP